MEIIETLRIRSGLMYGFGLINLVTAFLLIVLSFLKPVEFGGTNAWHKPIKFTLSTAILSWSLAWYLGYLPGGRDIDITNWVIVITLGFEVVYIVWQAAKGEASHFNSSTPFHSAMFSMMALAATIATLAIGYLGLKFLGETVQELPDYYLWAIRLGFLLFVIFSFEGFVMGSNMAHSVGGPDGSSGIPFLNWSLSYGDLRIAHFIGMHALQVLPFLAWYFLKEVNLTIGSFILYGLLAIFVLVQALQGKSIVTL
ncbi:MAG: hypothetical protein AAGI38_24585 [Bacteroidota bacterium]